MSQQTPDNQVFELIKLIVPLIVTAIISLVSLLIGFMLAGLRDRQTRKTELKNIRTILCQELQQNYEMLHALLEQPDLPGPGTSVLAHGVSYLSSAVFENYLDHLSALKEHEITALLTTYFLITLAIERGDMFKGLLNGSVAPSLHGTTEEVSQALLETCTKLLHETQNSLSILKSQLRNTTSKKRRQNNQP